MTSSNPNEPHRNTGLFSKYGSYPIESSTPRICQLDLERGILKPSNMKRPSFILCWVITTQNAFFNKYFLIRIWIVMFAVWSLGSQPFWLATRMCRSRMESWKDNIRKISRDPVKHQHWLQDKKLCEKKNSPIIFAVLGQQKYFAFSWLQFQLIVCWNSRNSFATFYPSLCRFFMDSWPAVSQRWPETVTMETTASPSDRCRAFEEGRKWPFILGAQDIFCFL